MLVHPPPPPPPLRHHHRRGVERDYTRAIELFEQSAEQGHAEAMHNLGCSWASGRGREEKDLVKARDWFAKAAAQQYRPSVIALPQIRRELERSEGAERGGRGKEGGGGERGEGGGGPG